MKIESFDSFKSQELLKKYFTPCLKEASIGCFPFFEATKNQFVLNDEKTPLSVMLYREIQEDLCELDFIAVTKSYRGQGLAKSLLDKLKKPVWLEVNELNTLAVGFYESIGFQRVGFRKAYYGNNGAILMEKKP